MRDIASSIEASDLLEDNSTVATALAMPRTDQRERAKGIEAALNRLAGQPKPTATNVLQVNADITGHASAKYRSDLGWVGGDNACIAWHVGSPPALLTRLMGTLLGGLSRTDIPTFGLALVVAIRTLQIHPFLDGNGRTARALLWSCLAKRLGSRYGTLQLVTGLWKRDDFDLHFASNEIRDRGDWSALLSRSIDLLQN